MLICYRQLLIGQWTCYSCFASCVWYSHHRTFIYIETHLPLACLPTQQVYWYLPVVPLYHQGSSGSSSSSSQDILLSPFPARCWPQAFHAAFIYNIQRRGKTQDWIFVFRLILIAGSSPQKSLSARREQVPFSMAIGNGELMHECFPKHPRMGTAR